MCNFLAPLQWGEIAFDTVLCGVPRLESAALFYFPPEKKTQTREVFHTRNAPRFPSPESRHFCAFASARAPFEKPRG